MNAENLLILVDGSNYLYRAYHAMPNLSNRSGQPTGAIYGVVNMLRRLRKDYQPQFAAVVFDAKGKNFRHQLFADYKATRPPMPENLVPQIEPVHELVQALGFPLLMESGVEADDVIATLTTQAVAEGMNVLIFTGDKDLAQLVCPQVTLINTMSDTTLDEQGVLAKFGVTPAQIVDYLTLMGDSSDNVPGVTKVGPKTAVKWLSQYQTLDNLLAHVDEIKGKVGENLRAAQAQLPLSKQLVTVKTDVELPHHHPKSLQLAEPDSLSLRQHYQQFEFKSWLKELDNAPAETPEVTAETDLSAVETPEQHYHTVLTQDDWQQWLSRLQQAEFFAFDTETNSLSYLDAEIVGVSFALTVGEAAYVPLAHRYLDAPTQLDREQVLADLKPLLEDPKRIKIGQNLKYDGHVLANHGIQLQGLHDTMLQSYVLDSVRPHDMDSLAADFLNRQTITFEQVAGKGAKQLTFDQVALEQAAPYAAEDADVTLQLHQYLYPKVQQDSALSKIYEELERPLIPVLMRMERLGVQIDADRLYQHSLELQQRLQTLEQQAHDAAGRSFNLNSPKQLQVILFEEQKLPVLQKTPKGQPSTAENVLQELAEDYPLPALIMEHRSLSKLKSTYTDALPQQIRADTGRVHTSYQQAVTATGRLSSTDPNLQNIPIRTAEGRRIRQAFVAAEGFKLVAVDYSQIELRIMAHLSDDERLLTAFAQGEDIHRATAAEVFATPLAEVSTDQRRSAKAINFGLIYGMSAFGLARQLKVEQSKAQAYIEAYFERYPNVRHYMDQTRQAAREQGYVETVWGRRLYLPEINSRQYQRRQYAERTAINAPMQGTAADIIKRAMIDIDHWIQTEAGEQVRMIMQVHDELVFEVAEGFIEQATAQFQTLMTQAAQLKVPLEVGIGVADNWDEAH